MEVPPSMLFRVFFHFYFVDALPEREYSTILLHMVLRAVLSAAFSSLHACVRTHQYAATSTLVPQYVFVCVRIGLPTSHASVAQCVASDCAAAAVTSFVFLAVATSRNFNSLLTNWIFVGYFYSTIHHSMRIGCARALYDSKKKKKLRLRTGTLWFL